MQDQNNTSLIVRSYKFSLLANISRKLSSVYVEYIHTRDTDLDHFNIDNIDIVKGNANVLNLLNKLIDSITQYVDWVFTIQKETRDAYLNNLHMMVSRQEHTFMSLAKTDDIIESLEEKIKELDFMQYMYCYESLEADIDEIDQLISLEELFGFDITIDANQENLIDFDII